MGTAELLLLAVGLSMDAFAVAVCKGLAMGKATAGKACAVGAWFGIFQAIMPLAGWLLGAAFEKYISAFDHWIAFALLVLIGAGMIKESFSADDMKSGGSLAFGVMLVLAVATSIDALAAGITFAFLISDPKRVVFAVLAIGAITFALSCAGVAVGAAFGSKYKSKAELAGGIILVLLGVKILLEHLGVISF